MLAGNGLSDLQHTIVVVTQLAQPQRALRHDTGQVFRRLADRARRRDAVPALELGIDDAEPPVAILERQGDPQLVDDGPELRLAAPQLGGGSTLARDIALDPLNRRPAEPGDGPPDRVEPDLVAVGAQAPLALARPALLAGHQAQPGGGHGGPF